MFIVLEGCDGCGKTTIANMLAAVIPNSVTYSFPVRTTAIGRVLDCYLKGEIEIDEKAVILLFAANRREMASIIEGHLKAGITVILDRYCYSAVAYNCAKMILAGNTEDEIVRGINWVATMDYGIRQPDHVFVLDRAPILPTNQPERYENEELQNEVRQIFRDVALYHLPQEDIAAQESGHPQWHVIDGNRPITAVFTEVYNTITQ